MTRKTVWLATLLAAAPILFVAIETVRTLRALTIIERAVDDHHWWMLTFRKP